MNSNRISKVKAECFNLFNAGVRHNISEEFLSLCEACFSPFVSVSNSYFLFFFFYFIITLNGRQIGIAISKFSKISVELPFLLIS